VDLNAELIAALDRLATALAQNKQAEADLEESAGHLAEQTREATRAAFARSEVRARRSRLHVRLAAEHLEAVRRRIRDDQRRVPARFRRRREGSRPALDLVARPDREADTVPSLVSD
jgi:hypothetical protein